MTDNLSSISAKIRALLAKTTASGCTEAEALLAAGQASANGVNFHRPLASCQDEAMRLLR